MRKTDKKSLSLNLNTVRSLSNEALDLAAGGYTDLSSVCPTKVACSKNCGPGSARCATV